MAENNICVLAVLVKKRNILVGLRHYTSDEWKDIAVWTLPGGRSEADETLEQTLRREVSEEVDITEFEIIDFIGEVKGAKNGDIVKIFYCNTEQDYKLMEPEKFSEWRWIPIKNWVSGETDSKFNPPARKIIIDYLLKL